MRNIVDAHENDSSTESVRTKFSSDIAKFQWLIQALPHFNRQLLVYILNLISLFALFANETQMTTARLVAVFQPALLAAKTDMDATEHYIAAESMVFLIDNEEYFLSDSWVALSKNTLPTKS
jgi:RhoGAP domain